MFIFFELLVLQALVQASCEGSTWVYLAAHQFLLHVDVHPGSLACKKHIDFSKKASQKPSEVTDVLYHIETHLAF